jgi:hypothetical protein
LTVKNDTYLPSTLSLLDHVSDHAGDSSPSFCHSSSGSSPSSRSSTMSSAYWGLLGELSLLLVRIIAELSSLDHIFGHTGDSSPSSRRSLLGSSLSSHCSTMSPVTLGTPRRALLSRPRLWPRWGHLAELSSLLVRLVVELSPLHHVFGHAGDFSSSSRHNVSSVHYQSTPCYSDQSVDLGHIRGLMRTSLVTLAGKLLDLFSLDPSTTCPRHLLLGSGIKWLHFTSR